jgi:hypothetical protein
MTTVSYIRSGLLVLFLIIAVAFAFSNNANAQTELVEENATKANRTCLELIGGQQQRDFVVTSFNLDDIDVRDFGPDHLAQAITYVRFWLQNQLGCSRQEVNFGTGPTGRAQSRCRAISERMPNSQVCYVESNLGYFLVHTDYLSNIVIQFHRWD